jgi:hypothetical protein
MQFLYSSGKIAMVGVLAMHGGFEGFVSLRLQKNPSQA